MSPVKDTVRSLNNRSTGGTAMTIAAVSTNDVSIRTCVGGACAALCPVYDLGSICPSPADLLAWFRSRLESARDC